MLRIGVAAAVFVIALTSTGSARGSDLPLFNFHRGDTVAIAIWRSADSQVVVAARHTATTDLNQGEGHRTRRTPISSCAFSSPAAPSATVMRPCLTTTFR